eukprot:gene11417-11564_t
MHHVLVLFLLSLQLLSGNAIGNITLSPVLIQKGDTKLALYGLGNVRDERLGRLFQTPGCVQWLRPASTQEHALEDWLNIFVLHQNRVQHGATAKNCLQERHLPNFMDLVIWGHEHECIPDPQELHQPDAEGEKAYVIQPGSSVATALSEGESKQKHAILLELLHNNWRTIKLPLTSVRPFVWDSLALAAAQPPLAPDDSAAINAHLERKYAAQGPVQAQAGGDRAAVPGTCIGGKGTPGFSTINSQRFGQKFVGKVANAQDMLLWAKAPARRAKEEGRGAGAGGPEAYQEAAAGGLGLSGLLPDQLDQARIEDLVAANLQAQLDILPPEELALALHEFVDKDEKAALANCVATVLTETQAAAMTRPGVPAKAEGTAAAAAAGDGDDGQDEDEAAAAGVLTNDPSAPIKEGDITSLVSLCAKSRQASKLGSSSGLAAAGGGSSRAGSGPLQAANRSAGVAGVRMTGSAGAASEAWSDGQSDMGPGVQSPNSQMTSSRSRTAGSSRARGRGGRGSRGGRSRGTTSRRGRGGRKGAAGGGGQVIDSDEEVLGEADEISDEDDVDDDDEEDDDVDGQPPAKRARAPSQSGLTGLLTGPTPTSIDGGFVDSSDDDDHRSKGTGSGAMAARTIATPATAPPSASKPDDGSGLARGRRRVLPASLGTQK